MKEVTNYDEFRDYLRSLTGEKPFDCENLAVLPEEVRIPRGEESPVIYKKGSLLCIPFLLSDPYYMNCKVEGSLNPVGEGELEAKCKWDGSRIRMKVTGFESRL